MVMNVAIKHRRALAKKGIGMPGDNTRILEVARFLREKVDAVVVGGVAVYLHGVPRATVDLDLYTTDRRQTAQELEAAGAKWVASGREHVLHDVAIHTITPEDAGLTVEKSSVIDGVRVVQLTDLIAIKLISGLKNRGRSKDLGDVEELIKAVPLDKRFAAKLPKELRAEFNAMVDAVRGGSRERRF
jgi:hypothetical protein